MNVRILKPTKSPEQSPKASDIWVMEFVNNGHGKFKEPLMGRTSSIDMTNEVRLKFKSMESAVAFAQSKNYPFELIMPKIPKIKPKNYASNFR
jgi:hypothetical protein